MSAMLRKLAFSSYYTFTGRGKVLSDLDELETRFHASRDVVEALVNRRLAHLLTRAAQEVPFYRTRLDPEKIAPESALDRLATLPPMTKAMIRAEGSNLHSSTPGPKPYWNTSGGSTGEPLRLLQDRSMGREARTAELLYLRWAGHDLGDPHLLIWGVPQTMFSQPVPIRERIFRMACNETYLNCYGVTDALLDTWVETINRLRPTVIEAYVDAAHELSRRILTTGARVHRPHGIIVSAGVLTPVARDSIAKAFGAPILNRYGSREVGNVACSCGQSQPMHVNEGWCHLEIVDESGRPCPVGVEGNVLVTVFSNHTMPLIRYQIEDRAVWSADECPCGRKTRMLASVTGRLNDYLWAADGRKISGAALPTLLYATPGIRQYQFRQASRSTITLAVVPISGTDRTKLAKDLSIPAAKLEGLLGGVKVEISIEEEIAPSGSGKHRYILNELARAGS